MKTPQSRWSVSRRLHPLPQVLAAFAVLTLGTGTSMLAQPKNGALHPGGLRRGAARPGPGGAKALERLSKMPPDQRERVLQRLPPEKRERVHRQLDRYNQMSPEERDRLHQQVETFRQLPPERQDAARRAFRRYNNLPPDRQNIVRDELQAMRGMSPEERRARLNSDEFRSRFKPHEQALVEQLSDVVPQP